jgi:diguanylate cyclase (GGDEF)-like protein
MCLSYVLLAVSLFVWGISIGILFWRIRILEMQVMQNPITGLPNERGLQKVGKKGFLERRSQRGSKVAVIFIDMDGFKNLNDTRGHQAGNEVLCIVAEILKKSVRTGDIIAHPHGDEFIIIMFRVDDQIVKRFIQRLSQRLLPKISIYGVDYTVGIAIEKSEDLDIKSLVHRADLHMNLQKIHKGQR